MVLSEYWSVKHMKVCAFVYEADLIMVYHFRVHTVHWTRRIKVNGWWWRRWNSCTYLDHNLVLFLWNYPRTLSFPHILSSYSGYFPRENLSSESHPWDNYNIDDPRWIYSHSLVLRPIWHWCWDWREVWEVSLSSRALLLFPRDGHWSEMDDRLEIHWRENTI